MSKPVSPAATPPNAPGPPPRFSHLRSGASRWISAVGHRVEPRSRRGPPGLAGGAVKSGSPGGYHATSFHPLTCLQKGSVSHRGTTMVQDDPSVSLISRAYLSVSARRLQGGFANTRLLPQRCSRALSSADQKCVSCELAPHGSQKASTSQGPSLSLHNWYSPSAKLQSSRSGPPLQRDRRSLSTFLTPGMWRAAMSTSKRATSSARCLASGPRSGEDASSLFTMDAVVMLSVRKRTRPPRHCSPQVSRAITTVAVSRQLEVRLGALSLAGKVWIIRRCSHQAPPAKPDASVVQTWMSASPTLPPCASMTSSTSGTSPRQKPDSATRLERYMGRVGTLSSCVRQ